MTKEEFFSHSRPQIPSEFIAGEALLRRIAKLNETGYSPKFALKGSFISRQFINNPEKRYPFDIDFIYLGNVSDSQKHTENIFSDFMRKVTNTQVDDNCSFRDFDENCFWRRIDYAMDDDFPTVNTDLEFYISNRSTAELNVDISFNLGMHTPPIPFEYKPLYGDNISLPYIVPISVQIGWKLHQLLVRPRLKDIDDIIYFFEGPYAKFINNNDILQTLINEATMDGSIRKKEFNYIFTDQIFEFANVRHYHDPYITISYNLETAFDERYQIIIQRIFSERLGLLRKILDIFGLDRYTIAELPKPSENKFY